MTVSISQVSPDLMYDCLSLPCDIKKPVSGLNSDLDCEMWQWPALGKGRVFSFTPVATPLYLLCQRGSTWSCLFVCCWRMWCFEWRCWRSWASHALMGRSLVFHSLSECFRGKRRREGWRFLHRRTSSTGFTRPSIRFTAVLSDCRLNGKVW